MTIYLEAPFLLARKPGRPMIEHGRGKPVFAALVASLRGRINYIVRAVDECVKRGRDHGLFPDAAYDE